LDTEPCHQHAHHAWVCALCKSIPALATLLLSLLVRISEEMGTEVSFQQYALHPGGKLLAKLRKK